LFGDSLNEAFKMAAPRLVVELTIAKEDMTKLMAISRSRAETASRVERSRMLLAYQDDPSFFALGRALGVHHQAVRLCVERAVAFGPLAALDDSPRPGKGATIAPILRATAASDGMSPAARCDFRLVDLGDP
jgi:hypothetical protein